MLAEILQGFLKLLVLQSSRHGTFHQFLHSITYKHTYLLQRTFRHPIQFQRIIAARSQVVERRNQRAVEVEDIGIEIELGMSRNPLDAEITTMKHINILMIHTYFALRSTLSSSRFITRNTKGSVLPEFPSLQFLGLGINHHIFIFYRRIDGLHIHRYFPILAMIVLHLQEVGRIPFTKRRMISQQRHSLTLIEFRGMNLEDDGTVEERQTRRFYISKFYLLLQYEGIFFHIRIILLQPIVLEIEILALIKNILARRSQ